MPTPASVGHPHLLVWSAPADGLRIACVLPRNVFRKLQPVTATVLIENVGAHAVRLTRTHPIRDYEPSLTGPDGAPAAETQELSEARAFVATDERTRQLSKHVAPGDILEELFEISPWFDLSRSGEYEFTLGLAGHQLRSPPLRFVVVSALRP